MSAIFMQICSLDQTIYQSSKYFYKKILNTLVKECQDQAGQKNELLMVFLMLNSSVRVDLKSQSLPLLQVFPQRKDFCYIFIKLSKICNDKNRRHSFEATYDTNVSKTFCDDKFLPNLDSILVEKKMAKFILDYAKENINVMKIFIKEPFYTRQGHSSQYISVCVQIDQGQISLQLRKLPQLKIDIKTRLLQAIH